MDGNTPIELLINARLLGTTSSNAFNLSKRQWGSAGVLTGFNSNITSSTIHSNISTIGGDVYNFDYTATNLKLSITSSSNADMYGSTGINILSLNGVDSSYNTISETILLNGTTGVQSINNFQMVNTCSILVVGSYKRAVGNIYINAANNENKHAIIPADGSSISTGRFTVPNGFTGYLDSANFTCGQNDTLEMATFIAASNFPLQQKASLVIYQNTFTESQRVLLPYLRNLQYYLLRNGYQIIQLLVLSISVFYL